jgi:hypothetical protein
MPIRWEPGRCIETVVTVLEHRAESRWCATCGVITSHRVTAVHAKATGRFVGQVVRCEACPHAGEER